MIATIVIVALMAAFVLCSVSYTLGYNKGAQEERQHIDGMNKAWGQRKPEHEYSDPADWWKNQ